MSYLEKRDLYRMEMRVPCTMEYSENGGEVIQGSIVKNLSGSGILFCSDQYLEPGSQLSIRITPAAGSASSLEALAEVVRCSNHLSVDRYDVACSLSEVS